MTFRISNERCHGWIADLAVTFGKKDIRECKNAEEFKEAITEWLLSKGIQSDNQDWVTSALVLALKMWAMTDDGYFLMGIRPYTSCLMFEIAFKPEKEDYVRPVLIGNNLYVPKLNIEVQ